MTPQQAAQQWAASSPGWGARITAVMERHDPRLLPDVPKTAEKPEPKNFVDKNPFEALREPEKKEAKTQSQPEESVDPPVPEASREWVRPNRRWGNVSRSERLCESICSCCTELVSANSKTEPYSKLVTPEDSLLGVVGGKKNSAARKRSRKLIAAASVEKAGIFDFGEKEGIFKKATKFSVVSAYVEKVVEDTMKVADWSIACYFHSGPRTC